MAKLKQLLCLFKRDERGVSAIEFGISAPVLLTGLLMAIDLGYGILMQLELTSAARTGGQYGVILKPAEGDFSILETATLNALGTPATGSRIDYKTGATATATVVCTCSGGSSGSCSTSCPGTEIREANLTITVNQNWTPMIPYPGITWPMQLTGTSVIRLQ